MSQDAEVILAMWREGRLAEVFKHGEEEEEKVEESEDDSDAENNEDKLKSDTEQHVVKREDKTDSVRFKKKFSSLCCSVM